MTPQRPALAEVLAALDAPTADGLTVGDGPAMTPAEAVEALATVGLWPWEPGDERAPRWWCEECKGRGHVCCGCSSYAGPTPFDFASDGHTADPPTLADIVAVASLGAGQLARYVNLAGEIARVAGCEGARVVWRAMTREAMRAWMDRSRGSGTYAAMALGLSCGMPARDVVPIGIDPVPFGDLADAGLYVTTLDASRIVLAVEAI